MPASKVANPIDPSELRMSLGEALASLRDFLEPLLVYHEFGPYAGIEGDVFRRRILYWRYPSIDTTRYWLSCSQGLGLMGVGEDGQAGSLVEELDRGLVSFLFDNFECKTGGFSQCHKAPATVYATDMAVYLLTELYGGRSQTVNGQTKSRFGYRNAVELQKEIARIDYRAGGFIARSIEFVKQAWDSETGGFFDSPHDKPRQRADVLSTHSGYLLLWDLEQDAAVKEGVSGFLLGRCLKMVDVETGAIGFAENPSGAAAVGPTYYALRILHKMGEGAWIRNNMNGVLEFLRSCWQEKETEAGKIGGFRSSPRSGLNIVSTVHALYILLDILPDRLSNLDYLRESGRSDKILAYARACQSIRYGGFRFKETHFHVPFRQRRVFGVFGPNIYATWHVHAALEIMARNALLNLQEPKVIEALRDNVQRFVNNHFKECKQVGCLVVAGYRLRKLEIDRAIERLLLPRNPLNYPQSIIRPLPFYVTHLVVLTTLFASLAIRSPSSELVLSSLLALEAVATVATVWWFVTR